LYHFRDTILKGNPDQIFVLHADIACSFVRVKVAPRPTHEFIHMSFFCPQPLEQIKLFHDKHRGVGTVMGVKVSLELERRSDCGSSCDLVALTSLALQVPRESAHKFGCIVIDEKTQQARHYVEKPESFISDLINGGASSEVAQRPRSASLGCNC
jgi:mannose-1-phosphate guanylyltransferase